MNARDPAQTVLGLDTAATETTGELPAAAVQIGELVAITNEGRRPLVLYPGQPGSAALAARTTVDIHGAHIGKQVVLMFEAGDPARPIVMGVLREGDGWPLEQKPHQVEVDADGERMIVSARQQLVLRCGKSLVKLRADGRIEIRGETIITEAVRANRVRGGSVELN